MHRLRCGMIICIYGGMYDAYACAQAREAELKRLRRQRSRASGGGGGGGGGAVKRKKKTKRKQGEEDGETEFDDGGGGGGSGIPVAYADPTAAMMEAVAEAAKTMAVAGGGEAVLYECRICGCECECEHECVLIFCVYSMNSCIFLAHPLPPAPLSAGR